MIRFSAPYVRRVAQYASASFGLCVLLAALHVQTIGDFFAGDDLSALSHSAMPGQGWIECFVPWTNGFWRPLPNVATRVVWLLFGYHAPAFHLASLFAHSINIVIVWRFARQILEFRRAVAFLAAFAFGLHAATVDVACYISNVGDAIFAGGTLLCAHSWMDRRCSANPRFVTMLVAVSWWFVSLAGKDTAVVVPLAILLWTVLEPREPKIKIFFAAGWFAVSLAVIATLSMLQRYAPHSYGNTNKMDLSPISILRNFADYSISCAVPYIHVASFGGAFFHYSNSILWVLRLVVLSIFVVSAASALNRCWQYRCRHRTGCFSGLAFEPVNLLVFPIAIIALSSFVKPPLSQRYLYSAIPWVCFVVASWVNGACTSRRPMVYLCITGWLVVISLWVMGPSRGDNLHRLPSALEQLVAEMASKSRSWPLGATISIEGHPHWSGPDSWPYCQYQSAIFLHRPDIRIAPTRVPQASACYRFSNEQLIVVPCE